jgi:hypothetical protein
MTFSVLCIPLSYVPSYLLTYSPTHLLTYSPNSNDTCRSWRRGRPG